MNQIDSDLIHDLLERAHVADVEYGIDCPLAKLLRYAAHRIRTLASDREHLSDMIAQRR